MRIDAWEFGKEDVAHLHVIFTTWDAILDTIRGATQRRRGFAG